MEHFFKFLTALLVLVEKIIDLVDKYLIGMTTLLLLGAWIYGIILAKGFWWTCASIFLIVPAWINVGQALVVYYHLPL